MNTPTAFISILLVILVFVVHVMLMLEVVLICRCSHCIALVSGLPVRIMLFIYIPFAHFAAFISIIIAVSALKLAKFATMTGRIPVFSDSIRFTQFTVTKSTEAAR
jgi:hypothetical protein